MPFFRMARGAWQQMVPATEVLWVQNPNPVDPYGRGTGLGKAIATAFARLGANGTQPLGGLSVVLPLLDDLPIRILT